MYLFKELREIGKSRAKQLITEKSLFNKAKNKDVKQTAWLFNDGSVLVKNWSTDIYLYNGR